MAIKVPIVSEFNSTGIVQANTALAKFGVTSTAQLTKAAAGFGLLAVGASKAFTALDAGYDAIIAGTGATGDALDGLKDSAKAVAREVPNSFADVGAAIAEVNTRLGLTGEPLENMTTKFLNLARVTGGEVVDQIGVVTRVFGDWGIAVEDQELAMDKLVTISQQTGVTLDELSENVVQFGAPMRQLGFSFEEAIAIFGKFEKEGVNTTTVMSGLRQGLKFWAAAGQEPKQAFEDLIVTMNDLGPGIEATSLAAEVFGTKAGGDMAAAITEGRFSVDELVATLDDAEGALDTAAEASLSAGDRLAMLGNQLIVAVEPAVILLEKGLSALITVFTSLPGPVQTAVVAVGLLTVALKAAKAAQLAFAGSAVGSKIAAAGLGTTLGAVAVPAMIAFGLNARKNKQDAEQAADAMKELAKAADDELGQKLAGALVAMAFAGKDMETTFAELAQTSPALVQRMLELEDSSGGLTAQLLAGGMSAKDAATWVDGLREAMVDQKVAVDNATLAVEENTGAVDDNAAAVTGALSGVEDYTAAQVAVASEIDKATIAERSGAAAVRRLARDTDAATEAARSLREENRRLADSHMAAEEAVWDQIEAVQRVDEVLADEEATLIDVGREINNAIRATDAMVMASEGLTEESLETAEGMHAWTRGMMAAGSEMSGPLADDIIDHIGRVNGIPPEKITEIKANTGDTLHKLAVLDAEINRVTRDRTVRVHVQPTGGGINWNTAWEGGGGFPRGAAPRSSDQPRGATGTVGLTVNVIVQSGAIVTPNDIEQWARTDFAPLLDRINREQGRHNG